MPGSPTTTHPPRTGPAVIDEPAVHRLVHGWLQARDKAHPTEEILAHLTAEGLVLHFPQTTLRGRNQFADWHTRTRTLFPHERHTVDDIQIRLTSPLHAEVSVRLRWQLWSPGRADSWIGVDATQHWSVVLRGEEARLRTLAMDRPRLLPGSAPLDLIR